MNLCVIPAKGTSRRIPGKNLKLFHGKPILAYSIEAAQQAGLFKHICVSTESAEVAEVAKQYGAEIVKRPFELAEIQHPDCGTQEVTRHAIETYQRGGTRIDFACCVYATAPLMLPEDLIEGFDSLFRHLRTAVYTYTVGQWYWGTSGAFLERIALNGNGQSVKHVPIAARICDINTMKDWRRAEKMYAELHGVTA